MQSPLITNTATRRWLILALTLIALSTVLFVVGIVVERGIAAPATTTHQSAQSGETPSGDADGGHNEAPLRNLSQGSANRETILGLNVENPWVVGAFVVVWLGLAVALLRFGQLAWVAVLGAALIATVVDVAEVGHQATEGHSALMALAVLVALAHLALVILAGSVLVRTRQGHILSFN